MDRKTTVSNIPDHADRTGGRKTKRSASVHPYYFSSFQSYCSGAKANASVKSKNKAQIPIPEHIKDEANTMLTNINRVIFERLFHLTKYTTTIPIEFMQQEVDTSIQQYLIDGAMLRTMFDAEVINWNTSFKKLYPIRTSGNGNCLLHAVLIAMTGIHDFDLHLRDRLTQFMDTNQTRLKEQWRIERLKSDQTHGITSEDSQLNHEWQELCDLARYENSENGQAATSLHFLEAVHIFAVSNMLRRPIIVLSEDVVRTPHGDAIAPNDLLGIYLPIFVSSSKCVREPIVLAYDKSHFCPLQTCNDEYEVSESTKREVELDNLLSLYQSLDQARSQNLLPVHFLGNDVSKKDTRKLLNEYLQTETVSLCFDSDLMSVSILCARLGTMLDKNFFLLYHKYIVDFLKEQKRKMPKNDEERDRKHTRQKQPLPQEYSSIRQSSNGDPRLTTRTNALIPPTSYSTVIRKPNNNLVPSRDFNNSSYEQRSLYDNIVANGSNLTLFPSNGSTRPLPPPQIPQKPSDYARATQRACDLNRNDNHYGGDLQSHENQRDEATKPANGLPTVDGKINNNNNNNSPRDTGSALRRGTCRACP